jgi:hypothetical protein
MKFHEMCHFSERVYLVPKFVPGFCPLPLIVASPRIM